MSIISRYSFVLIVAATLAACATQTGLSGPTAARSTPSPVPILTNAEQCSRVLQTTSNSRQDGLRKTGLRLFSWNTQKNTGEEMRADLVRLSEGADLILLQEAVLNSDSFDNIAADFHWSFSQGYRKENMRSGVTTASRIRPLAQCSLAHTEPWLRSPKATNITEFPLADSDKTLLVINLHLINFTFGVEAIRQQLLEALRFVERHDGPVIVSGDFNTWSKSRRKIVAETLDSRGLKSVSYASDYRKRVFGHALDHTYVRGIAVAKGTSYPVKSSDHNPVSIMLDF